MTDTTASKAAHRKENVLTHETLRIFINMCNDDSLQ